MKKTAQQTIRWLHVQLANKGLPDKLALYFHELEAHQHDAFEEAVEFCKDEGYTCVSAAEFASGDAAGKQLFISFDDNYHSWLRSLDLLDDLGVKAMFYTNTQPFRDLASDVELTDYFKRIDFHGERATLTVAELREIANAGHEIGCHTHSHFALPDVPREKWDVEIKDSKQQLEDILGCKVRHFSYPYGMRRFMPDAIRDYCLDELGFQTIAHAIPGLQHSIEDDARMINRCAWRLHKSRQYNIENIALDGSVFERFTGRSAIG